LKDGRGKMSNILKLYVMGETPNSRTAIRNLNAILEKEPKDFCTLEVVDVLKNPNVAITDKIPVTPTLVKISPEPHRRVIGDLSDGKKVMAELGLIGEPK